MLLIRLVGIMAMIRQRSRKNLKSSFTLLFGDDSLLDRLLGRDASNVSCLKTSFVKRVPSSDRLRRDYRVIRGERRLEKRVSDIARKPIAQLIAEL